MSMYVDLTAECSASETSYSGSEQSESLSGFLTDSSGSTVSSETSSRNRDRTRKRVKVQRKQAIKRSRGMRRLSFSSTSPSPTPVLSVRDHIPATQDIEEANLYAPTLIVPDEQEIFLEGESPCSEPPSELMLTADKDESATNAPSKSNRKGGRASKARKPEFNMHSKRFFLTWPQSGERTVSEVMDRMFQSWPPETLDKWIIAKESHEDGEPHIHAVVIRKAPTKIATFLAFDSWGGKHGNYKPIKVTVPGRSWDETDADAILYCAKGGNYIESTGPPTAVQWAQSIKDGTSQPKLTGSAAGSAAAAARRKDTAVKIQARLKAGATVAQIVEEFPGTAFHQLKKVEDMAAFYKNQSMQAEPPKAWAGLAVDALSPQWAKDIATWFNEQVKRVPIGKPRVQRPIRSPQLHVVGPPAIGKTTFIESLRAHLRVFTMPSEESWYDTYEDGAYDIAVLDEYTGGKTIGFLNRWLDGSHVMIPVKGKTAVSKVFNIPTIIFGNKDMHHIYEKAADAKDPSLEALAGPNGRLKTVKVPEDAPRGALCINLAAIDVEALMEGIEE